jgi:hypothetical protein
VATLTYSSGRASGCDSPGLLNPCGCAAYRICEKGRGLKIELLMLETISASE